MSAYLACMSKSSAQSVVTQIIAVFTSHILIPSSTLDPREKLHLERLLEPLFTMSYWYNISLVSANNKILALNLLIDIAYGFSMVHPPIWIKRYFIILSYL